MLDANIATTIFPFALVKISSKRVDDFELRAGEPAPLDVGAVGEQHQHAGGAELREAVEIDVLAVERRLVDLEVAGVQTTPRGVSIASATQSGMLCVTRRNSIVNEPIVTRSRGLTRTSRLLTSSPASSSLVSTSASVSAVP